MKRILLFALLASLIGCNQTAEQKSATSELKPKKIKFIYEMLDTKYPDEVEYTLEIEPDTMFATINNHKCLIDYTGEVYKEDGSLYFNIRCDNYIDKLYFFNVDSALIAFYVDTDMDCAGARVEMIDIKNNKTIWKTFAGGFNLARPVIVNHYAYLSTVGFVGKLDLRNGKFLWRFDDLYYWDNKSRGKYNSFDEPIFFRDSMVLFLSHGIYSLDSIVVDDRTGKILIRK